MCEISGTLIRKDLVFDFTKKLNYYYCIEYILIIILLIIKVQNAGQK